MLKWAILFFVLAFVSAVLGFGGVSEEAAVTARFAFVGFLALGAAYLLANALRRPRPS